MSKWRLTRYVMKLFICDPAKDVCVTVINRLQNQMNNKQLFNLFLCNVHMYSVYKVHEVNKLFLNFDNKTLEAIKLRVATEIRACIRQQTYL